MSRQASQEVCPFNVKFSEAAAEPGYAARGPGELLVGVEGARAVDVSAETRGRRHVHPGTAAPSLVELMRMTREDWDAFSRGSAIRRASIPAFYDESGSIGRRDRRQDEAGTPWCVTVDGDTAEDGTVTIRDRDSLEQVRVNASRVGTGSANGCSAPGWLSG